MPRLQESFHFASRNQGIRFSDLFILVIICMSALSIFWQTSTTIEGLEKEKDKKSMVCLKEYKENDCNVYAATPSEKCKEVIACIKDVDEPFS